MNISYIDKVKDRLKDLEFPCSLVVYGAGRNYRTKYRSEHGDVFGYEYFADIEEAAKYIDKLNYEGYISELTILRTPTELECV